MKNNQKIIAVFLTLALLGLISFLVWQSDNAQVADPRFPQYSKKDLRDSEKVIQNAFFYKDKHNLEKLRELYSSRYADSDFRLFNLASIKVLEIKLFEEQKNYPLNPNLDIERKNMIMYKVRYYVEFKDQTIEPMDTGEYEINYFLIRENNKGNWKIESVGV